MIDTTPAASLHAILRLPEVMRETGLSRSTVWQHSKHGLLPRPVKLTARNVGWPASEIAAVNAARIAGTDDDGIRVLIGTLHGKRQNAGADVDTGADTDDGRTGSKVVPLNGKRRKAGKERRHDGC